MDLGLFKNNNSNKNNFVDKFISELKKSINTNEKTNRENTNELTSSELSIYNSKSDELIKMYRIQTIDKGDLFIVSTEPPHMYSDRYKIMQVLENDITSVKTLYDYQLPKGIHEGDVIRKKGKNYIYDSESTQFLKSKLKEIENNIISERK